MLINGAKGKQLASIDIEGKAGKVLGAKVNVMDTVKIYFSRYNPSSRRWAFFFLMGKSSSRKVMPIQMFDWAVKYNNRFPQWV